MIQLYDVFSGEEKGDFISRDNKITKYRNGQKGNANSSNWDR